MRSTPRRDSSRSRRRWGSRSAGHVRGHRVVFDYEELEPATLKGKAEPVRVFQAMAPRARFGTDLTRTHDTPFVGREIDLALLKGIFDKTVASTLGAARDGGRRAGAGQEPDRRRAVRLHRRSARTRRPGGRVAACRTGRASRSGRSGEIVKAHAGILESDAAGVATEARRRAARGRGARWFRQRLLPLLGIEATSRPSARSCSPPGGGSWSCRRGATRRCSCSRTCTGPTTAMLAFLEHLADRAEGVPLLVVGTARPELLRAPPRLRRGPAQREHDQPRAAVVGGDGPARLGAARGDRDPGRAAAADPRPRRRQPAVRRGVRAPAQGP